MLNRNILRGVSIVVVGFASAAFAGTAPVFVGGHEPARHFKPAEAKTEAPYALTGSETSAQPKKMVEIRVGSRIVAVQPAN